MNSEPVELIRRPSNSIIRIIYIIENITVPDDTGVNVPVKLPLSDFYMPGLEWLTETKTALYRVIFLERFWVMMMFLSDPTDTNNGSEKVSIDKIAASNLPSVSVVTEHSGYSRDHTHLAAAGDVTDLMVGESRGCLAASHCLNAEAFHKSRSDRFDNSAVAYCEMSDAELYSQFDCACSYLKPLLDSLPKDLEPSEHHKVAELLLRNSDAFSAS